MSGSERLLKSHDSMGRMTSVSIMLIVVIGCGSEPSSPPVLEIDSAG